MQQDNKLAKESLRVTGANLHEPIVKLPRWGLINKHNKNGHKLHKRAIKIEQQFINPAEKTRTAAIKEWHKDPKAIKIKQLI
jgi:hypothetical protein